MNVLQFYEDTLKQRGFQADAAQRLAVERLQKLYEELVAFKAKRNNALKKLINRPDPPRGVYLWGGVGRGKSFLMDSFYSVVPLRRKTRIHFHEFMRAVHRELDELKGIQDPLEQVAANIAQRYRLICFDEFHVSDIADAMILYRLVKALFDAGVVFVMTSNYAPDHLYPDGLHRDRMLPAIALLNDSLDVLNVDSGIDYRRRVLEQVDAYRTPLGPDTDAALTQAFIAIAEMGDEDPVLHIEAREIRALRRAGVSCGLISIPFVEGRAQNDYLEIASRFHTVILSGVPRMGAGMSSEARRFTWLIDVFYDHRIKLIISAEVMPEELYTTGMLANEFHRTVSRITEMQSLDYLQTERRHGQSAL